MRASRRWLAAGATAALALVAFASGAVARLEATVEGWRTPQFRVPAGWPEPAYRFAGNPVTAEGFALGRKLFYDPRLSHDGTLACASCHQQFAAFAHYDHAVSHGVANRTGVRNAPGIFNLAWAPELMWDGSVHSLEVLPLAPLSNPLEMDSSIDAALAVVRADADYQRRFAAAFGPGAIDSQRLLRAMAQYTGTLISDDSDYDRYQRGDAGALTPLARQGLGLFRAQCGGCHAEPLFTDHRYRSNGLALAPDDLGRARISGRAEDRGRFRVPSLRNVALTAPYMHDGRYATLDAVLDHYTRELRQQPAPDPQLPAGGLHLGADERAALLAFLNALTDRRFVADARYAETAAR